MEHKSNITVASNIFVRANDNVNNDPNFVRNCRGNAALNELNRRLFGTLVSVKLTSTQEYERLQDKGCIGAKDGQMTHGAVLRGKDIVWECRCEYELCPKFSECMPYPIIRMRNNLLAFETALEPQTLEYEWLGTMEQIFVPIEPTISEIEDDPIPEEFTAAPIIIANEYTVLPNLETIISAELNTHLLINAGPGTGKTYTVTRRLAHIINSGEADLGQVLVLCYTNAARDVILGRLAEEGLAAEAKQLVICTLDSLAWTNLEGKTDKDLFSLGYNGCIALFNELFDAEEWIDFQYVIIDELQDLVNERAKMTLNILGALKCGYALLGDRCQAIYDYDCNGADKIGSVMFYDRLNALLPADSAKYELTHNHRQSEELAVRSAYLREVLLELGVSDANEHFATEISAMGNTPFNPNGFIDHQDGTTAILTRNNGEAEWVSTELHRKNITHTLLRTVTPHISINRWVADMFWDYREPRISRSEFILRYICRIANDTQAAEDAFDAIVTSLPEERSSPAEFVTLSTLTKTLKRGQNISDVLLNLPTPALTVSTIHKAKGREFDNVYLLSGFSPKPDSTEEARVWYVGATRPKTQLTPTKSLRLYVSKPTPMNRRMITQKKRFTVFCDRIVIGLQGDIDVGGFVEGDLEQALKVQEYIATQVKPNDAVTAVRDGNIYSVLHKGAMIGRLNEAVTADFWAAIRMTGNRNSIPPHLSDIFVDNIVTIVPYHFPSGAHTMFKESNTWLGVEITGFAKVNWHYGGVNT